MDWNDAVLMQENGFYFVEPIKAMLYFYDYQAKKSVPVCNKPDCEHHSGLDENGDFIRVIGDQSIQDAIGTPSTDCNAFIGRGYGNLTIYKNRIYYDSMGDSNLQVSNHSICSIKPDGTDKRVELANYLNVKANAGAVIVHFSGDKLFFSTNQEETREELNMVDLDTKKVSNLYSYNPLDEYVDVPNQYNNSIYYIRWNSVDFDDPHYSGTLYKYSVKSQKATAIYTGPIVGYTFVKNQIYFADGKSVCKMSLDGKDVTPIFDAPGNLGVRYDGKYLYFDDSEYAGMNKVAFKPILVTKLDGTKVDSIERIFGVPIFGDQNVFLSTYTYTLDNNLMNTKMVMLKKTDLGKTHHFYDLVTGKEISLKDLTKEPDLSK